MSNDGTNTTTENNGTEDTTTEAGTTTTTTETTATETSGQTFTQEDVNRVVAERLARERGKYANYDDLKTKAAEFDKLQDANKTDLEREKDARTAAEAELAVLRVERVRTTAANAAGLPAELHEFITATDPEKAAEQAKVLAEKLKPSAGGIPQGARQTATVQPSFNDWLRNAANNNG